MILPSQALLDEVLKGHYTLDLPMFGVENIIFYIDLSLDTDKKYKDISTYEFMSKCKDWVNEKYSDSIQLDTISGKSVKGFYVTVHDMQKYESKHFKSIYEYEAILAACQYILGNKEQNNVISI